MLDKFDEGGDSFPRRQILYLMSDGFDKRAQKGAEKVEKKIKSIATHIYEAEGIMADQKVRNQIKRLEELGYGHLPICMAKTQYSFSTDPQLKGAPSGHQVPIREVRLLAGAEFVVVICGEIMTMPGLPRVPAAHGISVNPDGEIEGLF